MVGAEVDRLRLGGGLAVSSVGVMAKFSHSIDLKKGRQFFKTSFYLV